MVLLRSKSELERALGYGFRDPNLLTLALTHRSYANEQGLPDHNERLEFLGDAVLNLAVGHDLMLRFPDRPEGVLSKARASVVNEQVLSQAARSLGLGEYLLLGKGEERGNGRDKDSVLADAYEAVIGAIFMDAGYEPAAAAVRRHFDAVLEHLQPGDEKDYKTRLQEVTQRQEQGVPQYHLAAERGPDHRKTFEVELYLGERLLGQGQGKSKKEAEQMAAREALAVVTGAGDADRTGADTP